MKEIRTALGVCVIGGLACGYAASQVAYLQKAWAAYAQRVDCGPVRILALCALGAAVLCSFVRDDEAEAGDR